MPIYEYQCEQCGGVFEVIQKFSDEPLTTHDKCGGHVHRLLSAPALQFKGTGWYITDYARGGSSGSSKSDSGSKSDANGAGAKSESKSSSESSSSKSETKSDSSSK